MRPQNVINCQPAIGDVCIHIEFSYTFKDKMNIIVTTINDWLDIEVMLHIYQLVDTYLRSY